MIACEGSPELVLQAVDLANDRVARRHRPSLLAIEQSVTSMTPIAVDETDAVMLKRQIFIWNLLQLVGVSSSGGTHFALRATGRASDAPGRPRS